MYPIPSFDPASSSKGSINTQGINNGEQIILFNSSLSCLRLTFSDKTQDVLPPAWVRTWTKTSPMNVIAYETLFTLAIQGQPISIIYGTLYEPGEHIAETNGPIQYVYVTNVSNAQAVTSIGFSAGNPILSGRALGDTSFAVNLTNTGQLTLGDAANNGNTLVQGVTGFQNQMTPTQNLITGTNILDNQSFNAGHVQITGSSGNANMWQIMQGQTKYCMIFLNGFQSSGSQSMVFPVPFSNYVNISVGDLGNNTVWTGFSLLTGGVAQSLHILTGLSSSGGSFTSATSMFGLSFASCRAACDSIRFNTGSANSVFGIIILEGN